MKRRSSAPPLAIPRRRGGWCPRASTTWGWVPTYVTTTKSGLPDALGPERVGAVAAAVDVPVIAIAGITAERVPEVLAAGVHGVAVVGAVSRADDPEQATADLLAAIEAST